MVILAIVTIRWQIPILWETLKQNGSVNRSGDIRLKAYNETNDRYYTRTNLTTQGIGIIFKKDFNKWSELLFWNRWKLNRLRKEQEIKQDTLSTDKNKHRTADA